MAHGSAGRSTSTADVTVRSADGASLAATVLTPTVPPRGAVVLAHGWTMSRLFWQSHAALLVDRGHLVVTWDQRGHGESVLGGEGCAIEALGDDLAAVLDACVPTDLDVTLVGHSMGAMTIMAWAGREEPPAHRVTGAVLANTSSGGVFPDGLAAITRSTNPALHGLIRQILRVPVSIPATPVTHPAVRAIAHGERANRGAVRLTTSLLRACSPRTRVGFARAIDALDLRTRAVRLDVPTVVVTGTHDLLTPPAHADALVRDLPQARLEVLAGTGHQGPLEEIGLFAALVADHAAATSTTRAAPAEVVPGPTTARHP